MYCMIPSMKCPGQANTYRQKVDYHLPGVRGTWRQGVTVNGYKDIFRVMEVFWNQIVMLVAQLCEYTENDGIVHFEMIDFYGM